MNTKLRLLTIAVATIAALGNTDASTSKAPPRTQLSAESIAGRIANIERLINASSAAERIDASGNKEAENLKKQAQEYSQQAVKALEAGRLKDANQLLEKSTQSIFSATRALSPAPYAAEKQTRDYDDQAESVEVLLNALERIGAEKEQGSESKSKAQKIRDELARSRSLVAAGDVVEGRRVVDSAYEDAKQAVELLREGDVVVKTLHFETPEDEYRYELDRNDTHKMLIKVLLDEKRESKGVDSMVRQFMDRSDVLRRQAEEEAKGGNHGAAIKTLEDSTKELLRAIRSAGVYIPG